MKNIFGFRCAGLFLAALLCTGGLSAQDLRLGKISFPNSGKPEAQEHFIRGVLYLHNFIFADA